MPDRRAPRKTLIAVPAGVWTEGVVEQDPHDLRHPLGVALDLDRLRRGADLELGLVLRRGRRELARRPSRASWPTSVGSGRSSSAPDSSRERSSSSVASLRMRSTCPRICSRNWAPRLLVELLVLEQLEEAAEREDRRAQLVRRLSDELLARAVEPRELALHVVERVARAGPARRRRPRGSDWRSRPTRPCAPRAPAA
jgi:hypothetical protein